MTSVPRWRRYLRFWEPNVEADIDDELRFHLEMSAAELEAMGLSPAEARRRAAERFGDVTRVESWLRAHDRHRHRRNSRIESMSTFLQDLRYGVRKLGQQPVFTASVVTILALGIGAATAMFSVVDAALLRPLPFSRDDQLVRIGRPVDLPFAIATDKSYPQIDDMRRTGAFSHVAAYAPGALNMNHGSAPSRVRVGVITPNLFETLDVQVALGRPFLAAEGEPGGPAVVILSHATWQRDFAGELAVLERAIRLNGKSHRVVGIMPPAFRFPSDTDIWIPLRLPYGWDELAPFRQSLPAQIVARLAPGVGLEQARRRVLAAVNQYAAPDRPMITATTAEVVRPFREVLVGDRRTALLVLLGATALVLLVACANVTNLLLSRATSRRPEIALRAALGASRWRIVRQLLTESVILAVLGGVLGIGLAALAVEAVTTLGPPSLAGLSTARLDVRVLAFSVAAAIATGIAFGLWPALGATRTNAAEVIKVGGAGAGTARHARRTRSTLVVAEIALALMLAIGAGLMLRSLQALLDTDPGVQPENVATLELSWENAAGSDLAEIRRHPMDAVLDRLHAMPDVEAAAFVNELPLRGVGSASITVNVEGRPTAVGDERVFAQLLQVSPRYFQALGIPLLAGTTLPERLDSLSPTVVINEALAERLWPGESPIGQRMITLASRSGRTVVGVVGNVRPTARDAQHKPQMYFPLAEFGERNVALVARGSIRPELLAARLRDVVREVDPLQAVYNVRPMEEVIATTVVPRRTNTILITTFGGLAVILAALGVYGVIAVGVAQRAREIGIRMALGARPTDVMGMVMREGLTLVVIGVAVGLGGAWALRRVMESMIYGVTPADPVTYSASAAVLVGIAAIAALIPARRATRVNPVEALRSE